MQIFNETNVTLYIDGNEIAPNDFFSYQFSKFDKLSIHSDIGSVQFYIEGNVPYLKCWGKITCESNLKSNNPLDVIVKMN